jgi:hypothetical protein
MSAFLYMELCTIAAYGWGWMRAWNVLDMVSLGDALVAGAGRHVCVQCSLPLCCAWQLHELRMTAVECTGHGELAGELKRHGRCRRHVCHPSCKSPAST